MQQLMNRFGGHSIILGKGKASNARLPEDQSMDNLLDNYAKEIIPNHFMVSTYDAKPAWMGSYKALPNEAVSPRAVKLGRLEHIFNEMLMQDTASVFTDLYLTTLKYNNVYLTYIRTIKEDWFEDCLFDYEMTYDLVLMLFIRKENLECRLSKNRASLMKLLLINLYKMRATGDSYIQFTPSRTPLGKNLPVDIDSILKNSLERMDSDEALATALKHL